MQITSARWRRSTPTRSPVGTSRCKPSRACSRPPRARRPAGSPPHGSATTCRRPNAVRRKGTDTWSRRLAREGTVEKYGSSWRIRYDAGLKPDGSRDQRSKGGFRTRKEAEEALHEILEKIRRGELLDARKITVGEFLDSWPDSKRNVRPTTRRAYAGHIRVYLTPLIGNVPLASLRADHLDRMYDAIRSGELRRPPGPATVRRIHATLRTALNSAYKRRVISYNPAGQVEFDAEPTRDRDIWTASQLGVFLKTAEGDRPGRCLPTLGLHGLAPGQAVRAALG